MCHAWLLRSHHGPDGARAHTGYAYGHSARAELRPEPRYTRERGPCSSAVVAPTRGPEAPRESVGSQPYAQCRRRLRGDTATLLKARQRIGANDTEEHAHKRPNDYEGGGSGGQQASRRVRRGLFRFIACGCQGSSATAVYIQPGCQSSALCAAAAGEWGFHTVSFSRRTKVVRGTRARRDHG